MVFNMYNDTGKGLTTARIDDLSSNSGRLRVQGAWPRSDDGNGDDAANTVLPIHG
jgi:hypothetical protein